MKRKRDKYTDQFSAEACAQWRRAVGERSLKWTTVWVSEQLLDTWKGKVKGTLSGNNSATIRQRVRPQQHVAAGPCQLVCWDITYLPTNVLPASLPGPLEPDVRQLGRRRCTVR